MADEQKSSGTFLAMSGTLALSGIALIATFIQLSPLHSSRPGGSPRSDPQLSSALNEQDTEARLWQDPFEAALEDLKRPKASMPSDSFGQFLQAISDSAPHRRPTTRATPARGSVEELAYVLKHDANEAGLTNGRLLVLPVMVQGSPYAEATESRIRARYAILSALSVTNFVPWDGSHIGYAQLDWPRDDTAINFSRGAVASPEQQTIPLLVPYEAFVPKLDVRLKQKVNKTRENVKVLVLWLNDDFFSDRPLRRLALFWDRVLRPFSNDPDFQSALKNIDVRVLGPADSDTLTNLDEDTLNDDPDYANSDVKTWTTAYLHTEPTLCSQATSEADAGPPEMSVQRVGGTDDELGALLQQELARCGVDLTSPDTENRAVLISEWDTSYGQKLVKTISKSLLGVTQAVPDPRICCLSYLRGVDGIGAAEAAGVQQPAESKNAQNSPGGIAGIVTALTPSATPGASDDDRPDGTRQLDYLRRMADELHNLEAGWSADGKHLTAIGILGSDVYDKLVVLRALRNQFPSVLFFTTDLDNRLLQPTELAWTRNLIVASQFGLSLDPHWQGRIPPFRDTYQTANFESCLIALNPWYTSLFETRLRRIFEIGRYGPIDLTVNSEGDRPINPPRVTPSGFVDASKQFGRRLFVIGGLMVLLVWPIRRSFRSLFSSTIETNADGAMAQELSAEEARPISDIDRTRQDARAEEVKESWRASLMSERKSVLFCFVLFLISLLAFFYAVKKGYDDGSDVGGGEPALWLTGTSIWPTELIRLCVTFLCIYWMISARHGFYRARLNAADRFHLKLPEFRQLITLKLFRSLVPPRGKRLLAREWRTVWVGAFAELSRPILRCWNTYRPRALGAHLEMLAPHPAKPSRPSEWLKLARNFTTRDLLKGQIVALHLCIRCHGAFRKIALACWKKRRARISVDAVWHEYLRRGGIGPRAIRTIFMSLIYLTLATCLFTFWVPPRPPYRGQISLCVDRACLSMSVIALTALIFFVTDAIRLVDIFSRRLFGDDVIWQPSSLHHYCLKFAADPSDLSNWLDVKLIEDQLAPVQRMIYYPSIALCLLLVARSNAFARWDWPVPVILIFTINSAYALFAMAALRQTASWTREKALRNLEDHRIKLVGAELKKRENQIKLLINLIEGAPSGVFGALTGDPTVNAFLIPVGGVLLVSLLQYLVLP